MRNRKAIINLLSGLTLQMIVMVSGIILPRFFLNEYGSAMNGLISSITQFLAYLSLAEAGVGSAAMVSLYKPLADGEVDEINKILAAVKKFYVKSGLIFVSALFFMILLYPWVIEGQIDAFTVRMMIIILAGSNIVDFFLLGKYKVLLTASQNAYIVSNIQTIGTIANLAISIVLIYNHASALLVKTVATFVFVLRFFYVRYCARKMYSWIDFSVSPKLEALKQKGDVLLHQIVGVIVNNTDIVILTFALGSQSLKAVSVYTIYNMVVAALNGVLNSFSNALTAGFGEVISTGKEETLKRSYSNYEYIFFIIVFIVCVCMGLLMLPFVGIYTEGINDIEYVRVPLAILFTLVVFAQNIRIPALTVITAAGHFAQTRRQAVLEAVINLSVSLLLVKPWGIAGVLIGTICSYGYRTVESMVYASKELVHGGGKRTIQRIIRNLAIAVVLISVGVHVVPQSMNNFFVWVGYGIGVGVVSCIAFGGINMLCEREEAKSVIVRVKSVIGR